MIIDYQILENEVRVQYYNHIGARSEFISSYGALASWMEVTGESDPGVALETHLTYIRNFLYEQSLDEDLEEPEEIREGARKIIREAGVAERIRFQEEEVAEEEGTRDDPRSPLLRGALARFNAGGEVRSARAELAPTVLKPLNVGEATPVSDPQLQSLRAELSARKETLVQPAREEFRRQIAGV